jgi:hypothetical protein
VGGSAARAFNYLRNCRDALIPVFKHRQCCRTAASPLLERAGGITDTGRSAARVEPPTLQFSMNQAAATAIRQRLVK